MDKKEIQSLLKAATEEINESYNPHKSATVKKVYLENAKRYIEMASKMIGN